MCIGLEFRTDIDRELATLSGRRNLQLERASRKVLAETRQMELNDSDCKRITLGLVQSQDFEYDSSTLESSIRIRQTTWIFSTDTQSKRSKGLLLHHRLSP